MWGLEFRPGGFNTIGVAIVTFIFGAEQYSILRGYLE